MIHISGDWYIDGDASNIILKQRKESKKNGEEYFIEVAYPGTFEQLMNSLSRRRVRMEIEKVATLRELVDAEKDIRKDNDEFYKRFEKEIRERLREESGDEGTEKEYQPVGE